MAGTAGGAPRGIPRIVHVETGRHLFGGARQVLYLTEALAGSHRCENVLVCSAGSEVAHGARERGIEHVTLPIGGDLDLVFVPRLMRILRERRADLVHLHSRRGADVLGAVAARAAGVPVVLSRRVPFPVRRRLARLAFPLWDHVIAISAHIAGTLTEAGLPAERLSVVPSAVDAARFAAPVSRVTLLKRFELPPQAWVVAMVAQLIPRKGHEVLIAAVERLASRRPALRVLCFGRGSLEKSLRARVQRAGLADVVRFPGFVPDMHRWIGAMDLLVHPARDEGLGVALLEAAAAGCPMVATPVGGIPEIVRAGETGRLVPVDDVPAVAAAIEAAMDDPAASRAMADRARALVRERHSVTAMAAGNAAVYARLIGARGS